MARYRLKKDHYLQNNKEGVIPRLHSQGSEIDWKGTPSLHMEPVDQEAKERSEERIANFKEHRERARAGKSVAGWTRAFEENMARIIVRPDNPDAEPQAAAGSGRKGRRAA